jgi:hypothetical protein
LQQRLQQLQQLLQELLARPVVPLLQEVPRRLLDRWLLQVCLRQWLRQRLW